MPRCENCRHAERITDDDGDISLRCACPVPFWVPLSVLDYGSYVLPENGAECAAFQPAN